MLTVSQIATYLYCKRKFYLNAVMGIKEDIPKEIAVIGTIKHDSLDLINKKEEEIIKKTNKENIANISKIYENEFSLILKEAIKRNKGPLKKLRIDLVKMYNQIMPFIYEEVKTRSEYVKNFAEKNNIYGEELWEKLTPKIKSEINLISKKYNIRGRVDRIEIYNDTIVPVEIKTGKAPKTDVWENHKIQLVMYMLMLKEKFKKDIAKGYVNYINENIKREIYFNDFMRYEIEHLLSEINTLLDSKKIPKIEDNKNKCLHCGLRDVCMKI